MFSVSMALFVLLLYTLFIHDHVDIQLHILGSRTLRPRTLRPRKLRPNGNYAQGN